jgi:hypothetical protein
MLEEIPGSGSEDISALQWDMLKDTSQAARSMRTGCWFARTAA